MAYDPNDPKDKEIVEGLISDALAAQAETHEAEIAGLKSKKTELEGKLRKARTEGGADNATEIADLERRLDETASQLNKANSDLREANRKLATVEKERDTAVTERDKASKFADDQLIENSLTGALVEAKVAPHLMDGAKALLGKSLTVKVDGDNREVVSGDKSLGDFVKEWASGEAGKHYITAPANGGGGANGANGGGNPNGLKKLEEYTEQERVDMARNRPEEWRQVQEAAGATTEKPFVIQ